MCGLSFCFSPHLFLCSSEVTSLPISNQADVCSSEPDSRTQQGEQKDRQNCFPAESHTRIPPTVRNRARADPGEQQPRQPSHTSEPDTRPPTSDSGRPRSGSTAGPRDSTTSPAPQPPRHPPRPAPPPPERLVRPCALPALAGPASGVRPPAPPATAAMLLLWRSRCLGRALGRSVRTLRQVRPGAARPRGGRGAGCRGTWAGGLGGAKDTGTRPARPRHRRSGAGAPRVARPRC